MPAAHHSTLPTAKAATSDRRGRGATPSRPRICHRIATLSPPMMAAA